MLHIPPPHELNSSGYGGYVSEARASRPANGSDQPTHQLCSHARFDEQNAAFGYCVRSQLCHFFSDSGYLETRNEVGKGWKVCPVYMSYSSSTGVGRMNVSPPGFSSLFGWLMVIIQLSSGSFGPIRLSSSPSVAASAVC